MPQDQCTDEVSGFCVYLMYPRLGPKEVGAQEMLMIADGTTKVTARNDYTKACSHQPRNRDNAIQQGRMPLDDCCALAGETESPVSSTGSKDKEVSAGWCKKGTSTEHRFSCLVFLSVLSLQHQLGLDEKMELSLTFFCSRVISEGVQQRDSPLPTSVMSIVTLAKLTSVKTQSRGLDCYSGPVRGLCAQGVLSVTELPFPPGSCGAAPAGAQGQRKPAHTLFKYDTSFHNIPNLQVLIEMPDIQVRKEEIKLSEFADNMPLHTENLQEPIKLSQN